MNILLGDVMIKNAYAKINLILDVIEKRDDGYHNIDGIMQMVDLYDTVKVEVSDKFEILCNNPKVPNDERNLVYKAFNIMKEEFSFKENFKIEIEKNIPLCAGIAGGSSNCAVVIECINEILNLNLGLDEMKKIGRKIGADVPYMLTGGTARTRGIGDEIELLSEIPNTRILIVNNGVEISTPYVYSNIKISGNNSRVEEIINYYKAKKYEKFFLNLYNVMEEVSIAYCEEIGYIKEKMLKYGAKNSIMSGSGPTVFGIFDNDEAFERAYLFFKSKYENTFKTFTIGGRNGQ